MGNHLFLSTTRLHPVLVEVGVNPALTHEVIIYNDDWHQAQTWCEENIGQFNDTWYKLGIDPMGMMQPPGSKTKTIWYFAQEKDAVMFKLKWS